MLLNKNQIARQDFVDNAIHNLMNELNPNSFEDIEWNIELIGRVRDEIEQILTRELKVCTEQEFYPYIITE
jgi:hypothetical protein